MKFMKVWVGVLALAMVVAVACRTTTGPTACVGLTISPDPVHMRVGDVRLFRATGGDVGAWYSFGVADPGAGRLSVDGVAGTASLTALKETTFYTDHTVLIVSCLCGGQEESTYATIFIKPR